VVNLSGTFRRQVNSRYSSVKALPTIQSLAMMLVCDGGVSVRCGNRLSIEETRDRAKARESSHISILDHPFFAYLRSSDLHGLDFLGITPVSNGTWNSDHGRVMLKPPGEAEFGSAGTQPDKGYPGRRCAKGASGPGLEFRPGATVFLPLDIVAMP